MNKTILYSVVAFSIGLIACLVTCKKKSKALNDKYNRLIKDVITKDVEADL